MHLDIVLDAKSDTWSCKSDDLRNTLALQPGLQGFYLTMEQSCQGDFRTFLETLQGESLPLWRKDLIHFRRSSLRNVAVVVLDIDSSGSQNWNRNGLRQLRSAYLEREGHWTMAERAEYARVLRDKLLAISPVSSTSTSDQAN